MQEGAPQWSWGEHRHAKTHVAISPVEAGIRAGELRNLAFPCKYTVAYLNSLPMKVRRSLTVAGTAHVWVVLPV